MLQWWKDLKIRFNFKDREFRRALKQRLGYTPRKVPLYKKALTHGSTLQLKGKLNDNERLEFLGDAVIELIVSDYLYGRFEHQREGYLTQMRSRLVSRQNLALLANKLDLGSLIYTTKHINMTTNILCNALEALVGAMYLDFGYDRTAHIFLDNIVKIHIDIENLEQQWVDYKSRLLELVQRNNWHAHFDTFEQDTNAKKKRFGCSLFIDDEIYGRGLGDSKKQAEQGAAQAALDKLKDSMPASMFSRETKHSNKKSKRRAPQNDALPDTKNAPKSNKIAKGQ